MSPGRLIFLEDVLLPSSDGFGLIGTDAEHRLIILTTRRAYQGLRVSRNHCKGNVLPKSRLKVDTGSFKEGRLSHGLTVASSSPILYRTLESDRSLTCSFLETLVRIPRKQLARILRGSPAHQLRLCISPIGTVLPTPEFIDCSIM